MSESLSDFKARIAALMKDAPLETVTCVELEQWRRAVVTKPGDATYSKVGPPTRRKPLDRSADEHED